MPLCFSRTHRATGTPPAPPAVAHRLPQSLSRSLAGLAVAVAVLLPCAVASAQGARITTPKQAFGANFGDDYFLADYTQFAAYWQTLAKQSPRIHVQSIGKTAEGREQLMAIVTSPANYAKLARYKAISSRLAHAEGLTDSAARALAKEGKAVVWIDGGLHANETLGAQQLGETVYQMVSGTDDETRRLLDDVIMLFVHANPDGNELIADWYMREPVPAKRTLTAAPRLYQKYIGHDNNRDFFASTQPETENINRVLYHEWFPQLLYNHHQSGPAGTIVYSPPFRDPYNYNLDPAMLLGIQALSTAMQTRLAIEGKPGGTMRSGGPYDGWWNGGIRNTATFHNTIAVLTEMIGSPTPMRVPLVAERQIPTGDLPMPIGPQEWHFRQSIDYSVSLNRAVLDYASRMRENLLFNIYRMGKRSIERGSTDTWTANPRRDVVVAAKMRSAAPAGGSAPGNADAAGGRGGRGGGDEAALWAAEHAKEFRDPRGYIIPVEQPDFPTAVRFVNTLLETGIDVKRATSAFSVAGKNYGAGSFVVMAAQAFRPHVMDMFEPQQHPDVFPYPGSAPTPPYDNAGWTPPFLMGVHFDRILDAFNGPFENVKAWNVMAPAGVVAAATNATGFAISAETNDAFVAVNRLLKANENVTRLTDTMTVNGKRIAPGGFYVRSGANTRATLEKIAKERGVSFDAVTGAAPATAKPMKVARVGLWDQYNGSIPAGWARWILEQFEFPFERVFPPMLDAGNLNDKFDIIVFVGGAIPAATTGAGAGRGGRGGGAATTTDEPVDLPAEYRGQMGRVSSDKTIPKLREFVANGGTVLAIGSSATNIAASLNLPITNHLQENGVALPRTKFYVPGSVLSVKVDQANTDARGMPARVDVFFDDSPVFRLADNAAAQGVKIIATYDSDAPLRSGWAWGQQYLNNGIAAAEVPLGRGKVLLFGPEILQRAQPHGTFKFLFNGIFESTMTQSIRQ